jgi:hypothetical protein
LVINRWKKAMRLAAEYTSRGKIINTTSITAKTPPVCLRQNPDKASEISIFENEKSGKSHSPLCQFTHLILFERTSFEGT